MSEFSLALNDDQIQIQKWIHDFAEDVIRPAAHEWDEKDEERQFRHGLNDVQPAEGHLRHVWPPVEQDADRCSCRNHQHQGDTEDSQVLERP